MTAKEALREIVDDLSEEQAELWLRAVDPTATESLLALVARLTPEELLNLPADLRTAVLRFSASLYTAADAEADFREWNDWEGGTRKDVHLIDS